LSLELSCSDVFFWGCSDCEDITSDTLPVLEQSVKDADCDGILLYCARKRKMQPQGAYYKYIETENWHLFDACGPENKIGFGNPLKKGE